METPLFSALSAFEKQNTLRLHMPGHKGRALNAAFAGAAALDFTELPPTGDLYSLSGPVAQAERLAADAWGAAGASFCTNGSTGAVQAALALCCPCRSRLIMERACHKSVYAAAAIGELDCVYLTEVTAGTVAAALKAAPAAAVCLTSPDYFGGRKDIPAIAAVCRKAGARLIVDEAHGAHLPFMEGFAGAVALGADIACASMHKTLPALGQSAILTYNESFDPFEVKNLLSLACTSSPSYVLMASMDLARAYMQDCGREEYARAARAAEALRQSFPALYGGPDAPAVPPDPCRLTLLSPDGFALGEALEKLGVYPEMADERRVVFILTGMDSPAGFRRLRQALEGLDPLLGGGGDFEAAPYARAVMSPGAALRAKKRRMPLREAAGRVCGQIIAPYPPALPALTWGEEISQKHIAYLSKKRYNILEEIFVAEPNDGA